MKKQRKTIKCPKCRSIPESFMEFWKNHTISFGVTDGKVDEMGYLDVGEPDYVEANCTCGHYWKLKGISQITEVHKILGSIDNRDPDFPMFIK